MSIQTVFKRYEFKYLLTENQKKIIMKAISPYMQLDKYGRTTIRNIYYDTDSYRLARQSIEKPVYKEKLRVRSYSQVTKNDTVFVEIKKKYEAVVYKRRIAISEQDAMEWLDHGALDKESSQIAREIEYFRDYYETLHPAAFLSYEREAYYTKQKSDFRVTFDENILFRNDRLSLTEENDGVLIMPEKMTLMEIKCSDAIPKWMASVLSENEIYKTSFSKYGTAYITHIMAGI